MGGRAFSMALASRLGELLVREKLINPKQLEDCLNEIKKNNTRLVDVLVLQKLIDEQSLMQFLSKQYKLTVMDLSSFQMEGPVQKLVSGTLAVKFGVLPVGRRADTLVIATGDPTNIQCVDELRFQTRMRVEQVLALPS